MNVVAVVIALIVVLAFVKVATRRPRGIRRSLVVGYGCLAALLAYLVVSKWLAYFTRLGEIGN